VGLLEADFLPLRLSNIERVLQVPKEVSEIFETITAHKIGNLVIYGPWMAVFSHRFTQTRKIHCKKEET